MFIIEYTFANGAKHVVKMSNFDDVVDDCKKSHEEGGIPYSSVAIFENMKMPLYSGKLGILINRLEQGQPIHGWENNENTV